MKRVSECTLLGGECQSRTRDRHQGFGSVWTVSGTYEQRQDAQEGAWVRSAITIAGEARIASRLRRQGSDGPFLMSFSMASTTFSVTSFWK